MKISLKAASVQFGLVAISWIPRAVSDTTIIPITALTSVSELEHFFDYDYPWGKTHNGAATMQKSQVTIQDDSYLRLTSSWTGVGTFPYTSGTVHAKQQLAVPPGGTLVIQASYMASVLKGTWPAAWLTGAKSWPPEIDLAEWKGNGKITFNAYNASNSNMGIDVWWPGSAAFHVVRNVLKAEADGTSVSIENWIDGQLIDTQYAANLVGAPLWLIFDLQNLASSGTPGPDYDTFFHIKDLTVVTL